ncbi:MAG: hypothetical protein LBP59_19965 [Planctomycetaceae bacterium]|jgi:hypothetical protein|nr:hypothetical protein [Planctomycetaceae bacterium]
MKTFLVIACLSLAVFGYLTSESYSNLCDRDLQNMIGSGECKGNLNCTTPKPDVTPGGSGEYCKGEAYFACVNGIGTCTATWSNVSPNYCGKKVKKEAWLDWVETNEPCKIVPNSVQETGCSE